MNALLVAVNATYSHTSLAVRYLKSYCAKQFPDVVTLEFNINQNPQMILAELARRQPKIVGFSCYIWNIELILSIVSNLRKVCPRTIIVLGGPEVSFDSADWLNNNPALDFVISGEGEEAWLKLLDEYSKSGGNLQSEGLKGVPGLAFRKGKAVEKNPNQPLDLAKVPYLYRGDLQELKNKIVYYETTRGCPFRCAYCLSSVMGPVRKFPKERYREELCRLAELGVEQVRFVDRTFNYDATRAYELLEFMISLRTTTRFQLEVSGDILTDEILQLLTTAPVNRFQFEIGVQSTHGPTLEAVDRSCDLVRLREVVQFLKRKTTVRVLLDLIAGLPKEGFWRFGESFDYVFSLNPDRIHVGFLKLLRGSKLRAEAGEFGCVYTEQAPYEVLYTEDLSFGELQRLKIIEDLVEKFGGQRFERSLEYLLRDGRSPFHFFNDLAEKWEVAGNHWFNHSLFSLYRMLYNIFGGKHPDLLAWLRYDFRKNEPRRATPAWMGGLSNRLLEKELVQSGRILDFRPETVNIPARELGRRIFVEELVFESGVVPMLFYFSPGKNTATVYQL